MTVKASSASPRCSVFPPSPPDSLWSPDHCLVSEGESCCGGPWLQPDPQRQTHSTHKTQQSLAPGGSCTLTNEKDMERQTHRGYQHGASRQPASSRTHSERGTSSGAGDTQRGHLLSPSSASRNFADAPAGADGQSSRPARRALQDTPKLVLPRAEQQSEEEEELTSCSSEEEESVEGTEGYKSGAERLAEKRKMKRFRLSHAQTRYLMSEFARQAHPNAEQRERLSRDIPGLSPRQVQVWFQNRRAKLKRLTTDDQERMMRSRALPEDFDFAQTLQSGVRDARMSFESMPSLSDLSLTGSGIQQRPSLDPGQGRRNVPPGAMSSLYTNFPSNARSATGSANLSPCSSINEGSQYSDNLSPLSANPHISSPLSRSNSLSAPSHSQQRQIQQSWQGNASFVQPTQAYAGNVGSYGESRAPSISRTPFPSHGSPQHALTLPQGLDPSQSATSLSSPNALLYNQRHTTYPQPAAGTGYYASSYSSQSVELSVWQSGQLANPQLGALSPPSVRQSYSASDPTVDSHVYNQHSGYQYSGDPTFYAEPDRQSFSPSNNSTAAGFGTQAGRDAGRRRGDTYPGHWSNPR